MITPPSDTLPIIHCLRILHKDIYVIGKTLPKSQKLGIHAFIEKTILMAMRLAIQAAFEKRGYKQVTVEKLRIETEILKHLIRTEWECAVIKEKTFIHLAKQLVEIGKMTNGWISFLSKTQKEP
ncbi:MAG TPA: four helix bundle protein [Candidatus Paceibacterota bacterium]